MYQKLFNNQQGIPSITGPTRKGMPFSGMIKLKLKSFKNMQNKITKSIFYFSLILELKKKRKQITRHKNSSTVRRRKKKKEKEGRKKKR